MTRALYPGSFDPVHYGHIDIASRASAIFDEVVMAIYDTPPKRLLFDTNERLDLARAAVAHLPNVSIAVYAGLTVHYAQQIGAQVIVRGLRNVADFEFEHQIGWANRQMAPDIELCCLLCNGEYAYLSATILKEVASLGGDYAKWAPIHVQHALQAKFPHAAGTESAKGVSRSDGKLAYRD